MVRRFLLLSVQMDTESGERTLRVRRGGRRRAHLHSPPSFMPSYFDLQKTLFLFKFWDVESHYVVQIALEFLG